MQASRLKTLSGMKILITRPKTQNLILSKKLRERGATTIDLPTIAIIPAENTDRLDQSIREISHFNWIVFTSAHGVHFFLERMAELKISFDKLRKLKVAAIGPATAAALDHVGKRPDYLPAEYLSEKIAHGLGNVNGKRILLPRADIASKKLPELLREHGAIVEEVVAYRTVVPNDLLPDRVKSTLSQGIDVMTFTSPSTVRNLAQVIGVNELPSLLKTVKVACIGPVTAEATRELGIHVDIVAKNHTINALVEAIENEI